MATPIGHGRQPIRTTSTDSVTAANGPGVSTDKRSRREVPASNSNTTRRTPAAIANVDSPARTVPKQMTGADPYIGSRLYRELQNCRLKGDLVQNLRAAQSYENVSLCMQGSSLSKIACLLRNCKGTGGLLICLRLCTLEARKANNVKALRQELGEHLSNLTVWPQEIRSLAPTAVPMLSNLVEGWQVTELLSLLNSCRQAAAAQNS